MKRPLILVAASGLAREALEVVYQGSDFEPIGVVDDDPARLGHLVNGVKVLGDLEVVHDYPDTAVLVCPGRGAARGAIVRRLGLDEARYATLVHPSAEVGRTCMVGSGSIVLAGCVLTTNVTVGRHVVLMPHVALTHDVSIADFATLCSGATLGGSVCVGEGAYIGMSSSVREKRQIGPAAVVGMGSVVVSDVPKGQTWFGVPARRRDRADVSEG